MARSPETTMKIGVMALQGAFAEHSRIIEGLGARASAVRLPCHLEGLDGIIIPGGESTTMSRLMAAYDLLRPVREMARAGLPVLGTCAGMILMAKSVPGFTLQTLGLMDITVRRNAFGSQVDSFESDLDVPALGRPEFHAVFIRAPVVEEAGAGVEVLARLPSGAIAEPGCEGSAIRQGAPEGGIVAVRQGRMVAAAFHPELTADTRFHRYFLDLARSR